MRINALLLLPEHTPTNCLWCQGAKVHLRKREQHNFRAWLKLLSLTARLLAGFWIAR